jgi:hypothetical protein
VGALQQGTVTSSRDKAQPKMELHRGGEGRSRPMAPRELARFDQVSTDVGDRPTLVLKFRTIHASEHPQASWRASWLPARPEATPGSPPSLNWPLRPACGGASCWPCAGMTLTVKAAPSCYAGPRMATPDGCRSQREPSRSSAALLARAIRCSRSHPTPSARLGALAATSWHQGLALS